MATSSTYEIILPKGEAPRRFFELSENERHEIGIRIFKYVTEQAAMVGAVPVTIQTRSSKRPRKIRRSF